MLGEIPVAVLREERANAEWDLGEHYSESTTIDFRTEVLFLNHELVLYEERTF